jgi:uncharacterized protein
MGSAFLAFTILLVFPAAASAQTAPDQPKIIVDGYGEAKTMPDVATISYTLRGEGSTSDEALRKMVASANGVAASLRSFSKTVELSTGEVRVNPVRSSDCKDRDYSSDDNQLSTGACAIVGYVATESATVRTGDVARAGTMVGLAGRHGAMNARLNGFELSDARPAKARAMAAALADAQSKATSIAAGSHIGLGPIITIGTTNREVTRTEDLLNALPQSYAPAPEMDPIEVTVAPEPITTTANVVVTYAIQR